jgi:hypothetical protein
MSQKPTLSHYSCSTPTSEKEGTKSDELDLESGPRSPTEEAPKQTQQQANRLSASELRWEQDPDNAHNWSILSKVYHTAVPCASASYMIWCQSLF